MTDKPQRYASWTAGKLPLPELMEMKRRGETGTAYVTFVIAPTGKVESLSLKKSSGFSRLDDAAIAAAHASSCKPYLENGEAIRATATQPYNFNLND